MKKTTLICITSIMLCSIIVCVGLIGMTVNCGREFMERNTSECINDTECTSGLDDYEQKETFEETEKEDTGTINGGQDVVWLGVDGISECQGICVAQGTVQISKRLMVKLEEYPENTLFAVAICFRSMVPNNYLDMIQENGITAEQYRLKGIELLETNPEAAQDAMGTYQRLRYSYFDTLLNSLQYSGEKWVPAFACKENFFFYTYMTKDEILSLKCGEDEALYVFAPDMVL